MSFASLAFGIENRHAATEANLNSKGQNFTKWKAQNKQKTFKFKRQAAIHTGSQIQHTCTRHQSYGLLYQIAVCLIRASWNFRLVLVSDIHKKGQNNTK